MTTSQILRVIAVVLAWAAVIAGARAARPTAVLGPPVEAEASTVITEAEPDSGARAMLLALVRRAPFRASGQQPDVRYDPQRLGAPPLPEQSSPPKPELVLVGLVLDGEPRALIQGVPGAAGALLLGVSDTAGGLRVRRIGSDRVRVTGHDTTWTLELRRLE